MKVYKILITISSILILVVLAGCTSTTAHIPKPEGKYVAAINASGSIDDSIKRTEILTDIATKQDLSEAEQFYLLDFICATRKGYHILNVIHFRQTSSPEVTKVLLVLIENPATTRETRLKISNMLSSLRLSKHDAKTVAGKLSEG